jgi:hypothetical protein
MVVMTTESRSVVYADVISSDVTIPPASMHNLIPSLSRYHAWHIRVLQRSVLHVKVHCFVGTPFVGQQPFATVFSVALEGVEFTRGVVVARVVFERVLDFRSVFQWCSCD